MLPRKQGAQPASMDVTRKPCDGSRRCTRNAAALLLVAVAVLAPAASQGAKVYKWTDAAGNVVYSDTPGEAPRSSICRPSRRESFRPLQGGYRSSARLPARSTAPSSWPPRARDSSSKIRPAGSSVSLAVEPPLRVSQGDAIRLRLDGQPLDTRYTGSEIAIPGVPRGTHTLQAEVVNPAGNVLIATGSVTFHVQEPSSPGPGGAGDLPADHSRSTLPARRTSRSIRPNPTRLKAGPSRKDRCFRLAQNLPLTQPREESGGVECCWQPPGAPGDDEVRLQDPHAGGHGGRQPVDPGQGPGRCGEEADADLSLLRNPRSQAGAATPRRKKRWTSTGSFR